MDNSKNELSLRDILVKRPFVRVMPNGAYEHGEIRGDVSEMPVPIDYVVKKIVTQEDFLRELDPYGHPINDRNRFPDIWRRNEEDGRWYIQELPRYTFAAQQVILRKDLTTFCGNDIQFELSDKTVNDEKNAIYVAFKTGWASRNMEVAWYKFCRSIKATGDGAIIGYLDNGRFGWKVLSFETGDTLYPHYDKYTGKLNVFARKFSDIDEKGRVSRKYVEVWDDEYYYRFVANGDTTSVQDKMKAVIKNIFGINGYSLEEKKRHNFESIPVTYMRCEYGPCWTFSEETIENFEITFSNLAQSNHDFGLPIMYVKGEGSEEISSQDMSYASKIMLLPSEGEIGFLNRQDASNAYKAELDKLEDLIYRQSSAVKTPELKSGDTPGVALKVMYSDAYEKAMNDAHEYDDALDSIVEIFKFGYGIEIGSMLDFKNTNIRHYIEPYIHLNTTEITNNLNMSVIGGFLSKQTASEKSPYATPNEWERICKEKHDIQMNELLIEEQKLDIQNDAATELAEEQAKINTDAQIEVIEAQQDGEEDKEEGKVSKKTKYSVATGRGTGRTGTRTTDKWGNHPNENNWKNWNDTH